MRDQLLAKAKRLVIKIGSSLVASRDGGLRTSHIMSITKVLAKLQADNRQIVIVSSGAIVAGIQHLQLKNYPRSIPMKQAAAAVGQSRLIRAYEKSFEKTGDKVAQILLTHEDLADRKRFLNARHTLTSLLRHRVIPIINENDSVSVDEIRFGDNDNLAGQVAHVVDADLLVIFSDVDGLFTADPRQDSSATLIPTVTKFTKSLEQSAGKSRSEESRGGMITKIQAAKHVARFGVSTLLLNGETPEILHEVLQGAPGGTLFFPHQSPLTSRKQWIAYTLRPKGQLLLDQGAVDALRQHGKSLLPSGILEVKGQFNAGDAILCLDKQGEEFAKGLVNYSAQNLQQIKGHNTQDIQKLFGSREYEEVIHRDNLVIL
ncbi:MAG: glutamate 5-kinase [Nitrospirales bacterium]|nr:glutamate 5-kinase [Nitrospira sp.]MDR4500247.1 glutamate 5-kinase [Nitrospirales bacterium]